MILNENFKRILSSIILLPFTVFLIIKGSYFFNLMIILFFLISSYEWLKMNKKYFYKFFGIIFLILSFYSVFKIRNEFDNNYIYLLLVTFICVLTDIGGYLFGKYFQGPKLTKISPNKTYSGMIGSFLMPVIFIYIFLNFFLNQNFFDFTKEMFFFIILISLISQIGDILVSYFKRQSNTKDTGNIIPGHGGILDRIDGMIFAFPFSYLIFMNWSF
jgi:phosphatidate cytidylyltransferase